MPENVLLVTIDSLRAPTFLDDDARAALESIDRMLERGGTSFSRAFATGPETMPSFPALLAGTLPLSYGGFEPLSDERPFLARTLSESGFRTGGFTSNPFLSRSFNYDTGFDEFRDYQNPLMGLATSLFPRGIEDPPEPLATIDDYVNFSKWARKGYQLVSGKPRPYVTADVITQDALSFVRGSDAPFFCWAHYMDVHHPCFPPRTYRDKYEVNPDVQWDTVADIYPRFVRDDRAPRDDEVELLERLYVAAIDYVDDQVQRLIDCLEEEGLLEETLVVLTSDHGELFGEHGEYSKPERLYDELLSVPLVASNLPGPVRDAEDDLVSLLDVPPIVLHALDVAPPPEFDGRVPGVEETRDFVLAEHVREGDVIVGARGGSWRYVVDTIRDETRVHCLEADEPLDDPAGVDEEEVTTLQSAVRRRIEEVSDTSSSVSVTSDVKDRLKAMGYRG